MSLSQDSRSFLKIIFYFFKFIFIFGCVGFSLLCAGFLQLRRAGATLRCGARASRCGGFSCCGAWALGAWASVVVAHGLSSCGSWALECRLSSCGTRAQLLRGMWDLPGPGIEPVSPALAGGYLTTALPGKSQDSRSYTSVKITLLKSLYSFRCFLTTPVPQILIRFYGKDLGPISCHFCNNSDR